MAGSDSHPSEGGSTAAVLLIGDEILSGRTKDANLPYIAEWLGAIGIPVAEARVVSDRRDAIAEAVNTLRKAHTYVFTTGGIGPTHDDITADSIAHAFGVGIDYHPDALAALGEQYEAGALNEARKRMARVPDGATLIDNPVSKAPGFQIENVFVMAGIPAIMQTMLESVKERLVGGPPLLSRAVAAHLAEGALAGPLGEIQERFPQVAIGSYPFYRQKTFGAMLVVRSIDSQALEAVYEEIITLIRSLKAEPIFDLDLPDQEK